MYFSIEDQMYYLCTAISDIAPYDVI